MKLILKLFGVLMIISGTLLLVKPGIIIGYIENNIETTSLYVFAIGVRLVFGILFIAAAKGSRYPGVIKVLGYFFIIAAIILIFIGQEGFQHFVTSIIPDVKPFASLAGLFAILFGGFLIYTFSRNKELM